MASRLLAPELGACMPGTPQLEVGLQGLLGTLKHRLQRSWLSPGPVSL